MIRKVFNRLLSSDVPRLFAQCVAQEKPYTLTSNCLYENMHEKGKYIALVHGEGKCGKTYMACKYISHQMPPNNPDRAGGFWMNYECPLFVSRSQLKTVELRGMWDFTKPCGLVLDDLESGNAQLIDHVFPLCNHRLMKGLPTVITTRLSPKQFFLRFGDRLEEIVTLYGITVNAKEHYVDFATTEFDLANVYQGDTGPAGEHEGIYARGEADNNARQPEAEGLEETNQQMS